MFESSRSGERGVAILELLLWLGAVIAVVGVAFYAWRHADADLTPEQEAYVRAVATQQTVAYLEAVAIQNAASPPRAVAAQPTRPAPRSAAPPIATEPTRQPAQPPAEPPAQARPEPPPPPAPPPPPPPADIPPVATCVAFLNGTVSVGEEQCRQVMSAADTDGDVVACIGDVLAGTQDTVPGGQHCTQAALHTHDAFLQDCFMGLAGLSHFGRRACAQYYNRFANP